MAEEKELEKIQDLLTSGSKSTEQSLKVEAVEVITESVPGSSEATVTEIKPNSSMSKGSNNRSSQISDTESMEPDRGSDDEYDDVEPDSIPSSFGSAFVSVPQSSSYSSTLKYSSDQASFSGNCGLSSELSMSNASASEPVKESLTVVQQISEMHSRRKQAEEADFFKIMDRVSTLEQRMEMLSLQNKDLTHQVKLLKEDNNRLRSTPGGVLEEQNRHLVEQVRHLQENLRQAVERMYHYQSRCEKFELLQTERVHAGPAVTGCGVGTCSYLPSAERPDEPDTMPGLQDSLVTSPDPSHCNDGVTHEEEKQEEEETEEEEEEEGRKQKTDNDRK